MGGPSQLTDSERRYRVSCASHTVLRPRDAACPVYFNIAAGQSPIPIYALFSGQ